MATRPYRSDQREAQARTTRRRIVEAATAAFLERGYAGTTIRGVARSAGVSVPGVEIAFGTKARLLKAAIDVAIAGDDEPVAMLDREWADRAGEATTAADLLTIATGVLGPAQVRSAGLVLAVLEGAVSEGELNALADQLIEQRAVTAGWLVDALARVAGRPAGLGRTEAIDTMWILMDPAVFDRLTRQRHWSVGQYQRWFARSALRLFVASGGAA